MRRLFFLLLVTLALPLQAQTCRYVTVQTTDGAQHSMTLSGLKITFAQDQMTMQGTEGTLTFALHTLSELFFATAPTGIAAAQTDHVTCRPAIVHGKLTGVGPEDASISIFTPDGRRVANGTLTHGTYLVRIDGITYKILAQ